MRLVRVIMLAWPQCPAGLAGLSRAAIGPAATAMTTLTGARMTTVQVSRAEEVWVTCRAAAGSVPARRADRASTGTMTLVSAPPSTMS